MIYPACFLIGHADTSEELYPALLEAIELHITNYGIREFFFGHHGGFDRLTLRVLKEAKIRHPEIQRILVLSYHPAQHTPLLPEDIDESYYPFDTPVPPRYAIPKANRRMIDRCSHLIVYAAHPGKTRDFAAYAQQKGKKIQYIKRT